MGFFFFLVSLILQKMRVTVSWTALSLLLFAHGLAAQSEVLEGQLQGENVDDTLKRAAENTLAVDVPVVSDDGFVYPYFFEIKDAEGQIAARLNLTLGPFSLDLVKTKLNDKKKVDYVRNAKYSVWIHA